MGPRSLPVLAFVALACSSTAPHDAGSAGLERELDLNDVSVLFPLPPSGGIDQLLAPSSRGAHGELLPASTFELAPGADAYARLRVVSVRVDPCFPSLAQAPSPTCRFQVRLVLQPLHDDGVSVQAEPAAVHLFYDLPVGAFVALLRDLVAAREAADPLAPLDVHPTLVAEGLSGPYALGLRQALLRAIGEERLTRMTFIARNEGQTFQLGGFDFVGGEVSEQSLSHDSPADPLAFSATVMPNLALASDDLSPLYDSQSAAALGEDALWSLYEAALRVENPSHRSPANVDCVTCHTAQPARLWLERTSELGKKSSAFRFTSSFDLTVKHANPETTSAPLAFAWLGDRPAISARAVNDSAAVASYLNEQLSR